MIPDGYNKDVSETFGINIYANPVFNRITVSVNTDFEIDFANGFAKILGFEKSQLPISNNEVHGDMVPKMERVDNVVVNCNLVENNYNYSSNVIYTFTPDQPFGSLMSIKPYYPGWTNCRNASFNYIEVWFTDQENRPLEIEDNVIITIDIKDT